jgi:hypothetical protein
VLFLHGLILSAVACDNAPPAVDPCNTATFNQPACEVAVQNHGYHDHGAWVPFFLSRRRHRVLTLEHRTLTVTE